MRMRHPTLPDSPPATVARESFERVWRKRGWVDADEPPKKTTKKSTNRAPEDGGLSHATTEEG